MTTCLQRFQRAADKCRNSVDVTRLWNLADDTSTPEPYWDVLLATYPWTFRDRHDSNSHRQPHITVGSHVITNPLAMAYHQLRSYPPYSRRLSDFPPFGRSRNFSGERPPLRESNPVHGLQRGGLGTHIIDGSGKIKHYSCHIAHSARPRAAEHPVSSISGKMPE